MSKVIKETGNRELSHIVQTADGKFHYVDSNDTFDKGYETMSFPCKESGEVTSWLEEYCERY